MFFLAYHSSRYALICKEKNLLRIEQLTASGDDVNPLYTRAEIVTGLGPRDVLLRTLSLKLKSKREVLAALPFQVENILPYTADELILLPTLHKKTDETEVFLLASSQSALERHLSDLEIDPDTVSCVPTALFRFAVHYLPNCPALFVYHCDEDEHTFIVIKEGRLTASQVQRAQDFERICAYMQKKFPEIDLVLHTGTDNLPTPFIPIELENPNLAEFAVPIGLAFDAARGGAQFRQTSLSKKQLKERKKRLFTFLSVCSCFILTTLVLGHLNFKRVENAALAELGSPQGTRLQEFVTQLASSLQAPKKSSLNLPTIPKVHEVLTWLSAHPALREECSINHFRYEVVNAPKLGSQVKTYAATVDLELTFPSARAARIFHEALLKEDVMVDQKNPIQWKGDHGIYRAKFYLKPRAIK